MPVNVGIGCSALEVLGFGDDLVIGTPVNVDGMLEAVKVFTIGESSFISELIAF